VYNFSILWRGLRWVGQPLRLSGPVAKEPTGRILYYLLLGLLRAPQECDSSADSSAGLAGWLRPPRISKSYPLILSLLRPKNGLDNGGRFPYLLFGFLPGYG